MSDKEISEKESKRNLSRNKLKQALIKTILAKKKEKKYICSVCSFKKRISFPFNKIFLQCRKCNKHCCSVKCSAHQGVVNGVMIRLCLRCAANHSKN
jgi:hypothetical protein